MNEYTNKHRNKWNNHEIQDNRSVYINHDYHSLPYFERISHRLMRLPTQFPWSSYIAPRKSDLWPSVWGLDYRKSISLLRISVDILVVSLWSTYVISFSSYRIFGKSDLWPQIWSQDLRKSNSSESLSRYTYGINLKSLRNFHLEYLGQQDFWKVWPLTFGLKSRSPKIKLVREF